MSDPAPVIRPQARAFADIHIGDRAHFDVTMGDILLQDFARLSGDYNPLHLDESYARTTQFGGRIVHGMLVSSFFSQLVGMHLPGLNAVYLSQTMDFLRPVHIGDEIEISGEVVHKSETSRVITLRTRAYRQGELLVDGEAKIMVLEAAAAELPAIKAVSLDFSGQVVLVTGANRGIGAAIAMLFAQHGAAVAINYRASRAQAEQIVSALREAGRTAQAFQADITDASQIQAMIAQIHQELGTVSILVNNASGDFKPLSFAETTGADFQQNLDVTCTGAFQVVQAVLPDMLAIKRGKIINVGSTATIGAPPDKVSRYVVAKQALVGLTRALAVELGPKGIQVNMVAPGLTETALTAHLPQRIKDLTAFQSPLHRNATPEDTARAVLFLGSEMADFVTGVILPVNGGIGML
jgi:3-oxoacyl-[acyl-carrier protein] reductase